MPATPDPLCGKCGYCIRGIPSFACPECGSDLREVGIVTIGSTKFRSLLLAIPVWTFLCITIGIILLAIASAIAPRLVVGNVSRVIFFQRIDMFVTLRAEASGKHIAWPARAYSTPVKMQSMRLTFQQVNHPNREMYVDLTGGKAFYDINSRSVTLPWNAAAMERWFADCGFNLTDPVHRADVDAAFSAIDHMPASVVPGVPAPGQTEGTLGKLFANSPFAYAFVIFHSSIPKSILLFSTLLWLFGIFQLWRGARRSVRKLPLTTPIGNPEQATDGSANPSF